MVEMGEKYSNSVYLVKVVLTGFAHELEEGRERERQRQG